MKKWTVLLLVVFLLSGCSAKQPEAPQTFSLDDYDTVTAVNDPLEGFNRAMFSFNHVLLLNVIKPVHQGYEKVVPKRIRSGISNFTYNLMFPVRFVNYLLQFDLGAAGTEFGHFFVNTFVTLGLGDVASANEHYYHYDPRGTDFGMTLAKWGVGEGPYLVLPFFGPTTVRDALGKGVDMAMDPLPYVAPMPVNLTRTGLKFNDMDTVYSPYEQLTNMAIEPYSAVRDAILNQRRGRIQAAQESQ